MKINGEHYQSIWETNSEVDSISIIDQRFLPHKFFVTELSTFDDFCFAIKEMLVRGAPLIGIVAAYGCYFAIKNALTNDLDKELQIAAEKLLSTRPTAVNIKFAVERVITEIGKLANVEAKIGKSLEIARKLRSEDIEICRKLGQHGVRIIKEIYEKKGSTVNVLTHCNAGWLATVDYGTATAPIYFARDAGIPLHVWIDETRPRNQGAKLTAFELLHENIPHTLIVDNAGGLLMQKGMVDLVIVGTDRTSLNGDVANKVGTYLKALAAYDNNVPFYVAVPSSSIDFDIEDGLHNIPIEERDEKEVKYAEGLAGDEIANVLICPKETPALNYAFDITPARLVTGFITERGVCRPNKESILNLFPENRK